MAGRPSAVTQAGLDAQLTQKGDGKWQIVLTDDEGTEVFSRVYTTSHIAKQSARDWVRRNYQVTTQETEARPRKRASPYSAKAPSASHLTRLLNLRADRNESQAIELRATAERLETEAKRLREAADTLEQTDGS
jgi:hypothetical protein